MAAIAITISGVLYDKVARTTRNVVLIGEASYTGLGVGGGPILPPAGGGEPPVITQPPPLPNRYVVVVLDPQNGQYKALAFVPSDLKPGHLPQPKGEQPPA